MKRREFLVFAAAAASGLACNGCKRPPPAAGGPRLVALGNAADYTHGLSEHRETRLGIWRDSAGVACVSMVCTHQICLLNASEDGESLFICPCHGSRFSESGAVLGGPAEKPLPWYKLSVNSSGRLIADLAQEVGPDFRLKLS